MKKVNSRGALQCHQDGPLLVDEYICDRFGSLMQALSPEVLFQVLQFGSVTIVIKSSGIAT